jgi:hypothetical protein
MLLTPAGTVNMPFWLSEPQVPCQTQVAVLPGNGNVNASASTYVLFTKSVDAVGTPVAITGPVAVAPVLAMPSAKSAPGLIVLPDINRLILLHPN